MTTDPEIRPLRGIEEAQACVDLMRGSDPWVTLGFDPEAALKGFTDSRREVYVTYDNEGMAGFVSIDMRGLVAGYIHVVCVRSDRRGQGLGSQLVRWAETRIFKDSPNAFICVSSFNTGAHRLYERLGFTSVGVLRQFIISAHDEVLLRKSRGPWADFQRSV